MSDPRVRAAVIDDAAAIARIHIQAWREAYRGLVPDRILDGFDVDRRTRGWRTRLEGGHDAPSARTWVVVDVADVVMGFAATGPANDEAAPPPSGAGEVESIYVDPTATGRGLGRTLFRHATDDLARRGFDPIVVWVFEANMRARRFYEAAGARVDGTRHHIDFDGTAVPEIRYLLTHG